VISGTFFLNLMPASNEPLTRAFPRSKTLPAFTVSSKALGGLDRLAQIAKECVACGIPAAIQVLWGRFGASPHRLLPDLVPD